MMADQDNTKKNTENQSALRKDRNKFQQGYILATQN